MSLLQTLKDNRVFQFLSGALIFSTLFQDVLHPGIWGDKIQLTEILFIPFFIYFCIIIAKHIFQQGSRTSPGRIFSSPLSRADKLMGLFLLIYLLGNIISSLNSGVGSSLLESFGRIYLGLIFTVLVIYMDQFAIEELKQKFSVLLFHMGWFLSVLALSGYLFHVFGLENSLIIRLDEYPYLGTVYRLKGPTFTPTMFCTLLVPCIFIPLANYEQLPFSRKWRKLLFALIILAAFFSFSKSFFIIAWGLLLWVLRRKQKLTAIVIWITIIPLVVFLFIATHFVFAEPGTVKYERYMQTSFISDKSAFRIGNIQALETSYYLNKKIEIEIFRKNPVLGIGAGNFNSVVDEQKAKGTYPGRFFSYDPHSAWLGALAENGLSGFLSIMIFILLMYKQVLSLKEMRRDPMYFAVFLVFSFFLIEGVSTDILNFRHLWIFLAFAAVFCRKKLAQKRSMDNEF